MLRGRTPLGATARAIVREISRFAQSGTTLALPVRRGTVPMNKTKAVKLIVKSGVKAGFNPQPDPPGRHGVVSGVG